MSRSSVFSSLASQEVSAAEFDVLDGGITSLGTVATGTLGSGVVFPAGMVRQVKQYSYRESQTLTFDAKHWLTKNISGGSTNRLNFDSAIISGSKVILTFDATISADSTSMGFAKFFVTVGATSQESGYPVDSGELAGVSTEAQPQDGLCNVVFAFSSVTEYGEARTIAFSHRWTESATTPDINIILDIDSYNASTSGNFYIGLSGYNNTATDVITGYRVTLMEVTS